MMNKTFRLVPLAIGCVAAAHLPMTVHALDPVASATAANVTAAGATSYSFTVRYADDGVVGEGIDDHDVRVTGPGGFNVPAAFVTVVGNLTETVQTATYLIMPPGGSWDSSDNGTYNVVMQPMQVFDSIANPVAPGLLRSFTVNIAGPPPAAQPLNLSTRLRVQTGDNVMIGGFIVTGTGSKRVIVRALGPSLADLGVPGALPDPNVTLVGGAGPIASNDNWKTSQQMEIQATGVPPLRDAEAALVVTLPPGAYTAIVAGNNLTTGVGLVEIYDLEAANAAKLANISTRGVVETGDNVMIAGFILGQGAGNGTVGVRALGPSLSGSGINSVLADPVLQLFNSNGQLIQSNNNWKETQQGQIQMAGLALQYDAESALIATLAPGAYTAIVSGGGGNGGVALVEVFHLP